MRTVVTFRAAWCWLILWVLLDLTFYYARDFLPASFVVNNLNQKLMQDFSIATFLLGLWLFESFKISKDQP